MRLQHSPKLQDRGLVRDRILVQLHADKPAHRFDLVQRILQAGSLRVPRLRTLLFSTDFNVNQQRPSLEVS